MDRESGYDLCWVDDIIEKKACRKLDNLCKNKHFDYLENRDNKEQDETTNNFVDDFRKKSDEKYPISIRVSPYASQNEIVDYIKKRWEFIKELQDFYRKSNVKIGRVKKKNPKVQERNDFIYQNRKLPLKKISKLVSDQEKWGDGPDIGHIGKIISLEKKKRKEL